MNHLRVYGYQFGDDTEVEITTKSGQEYCLRKVTPDTLGMAEENTRLKLENGVFIINKSVQKLNRMAIIPPEENWLVVSDSTRQERIASFGFPAEGIRVGHPMKLKSLFGITTSTIKKSKPGT